MWHDVSHAEREFSMSSILRILLLVMMSWGLGMSCGILVGEHRTVASEKSEQDDMVQSSYLEGYADALVDVMGVVSSGGGIDEVLSFARGATGRFK